MIAHADQVISIHPVIYPVWKGGMPVCLKDSWNRRFDQRASCPTLGRATAHSSLEMFAYWAFTCTHRIYIWMREKRSEP